MKGPFIQWLYALTTISGELAPTSRLPKYQSLTVFLNVRRPT